MDSDYDPDARVTHSHKGGVRHTHRDPSIKHDPQPDLDPDPIPNIVLHPGDTIGVAVIDNDAIVTLRGGRDGQPYAVLDCERNLDGHFIICDIRFVAAKRGVLPVRAEPYENIDTVSATYDTDGNPVTTDDPNLGANTPTHPDARPANLILSHFGRVTPIDTRHYPYSPDTSGALTDASVAAALSSLTVTHFHVHTHAGDVDADVPAHEHDHQHTGAEALSRAHVFGHWDDLHTHTHDY